MSELPVNLEAHRWRPMKHVDLPTVNALAREIHASYPEDEDVFQEKLELFPYGCFALEGKHSVAGYCFSHPWAKGALPPLNTMIRELPRPPSTYLIHDVAIARGSRQHGAAKFLTALLPVVAKLLRIEHMTLVSVNNTTGFWRKNGFLATPDCDLQRAVRDKYGEEAVHMEAALGQYF